MQLLNRRNRKIQESFKGTDNFNKYKLNWKKYKTIADKEPNKRNLLILAKFTSKDYIENHFYK